MGLRTVLTGVVLMIGCGGAEDGPTRRGGGGGAAGTDTDGSANPGGDWIVDFDRYGSIPLGVDFDEALAASDGLIQDPERREGCTMTSAIGGPEEVSLMVVDGRVVRVDVSNPRVKTRAGAGIGDSEERIRELYSGTLQVEPHKYTEGHYLVVTPSEGSERRLIFETDGLVVRTYRAGVLPEVAWVEGCS